MEDVRRERVKYLFAGQPSQIGWPTPRDCNKLRVTVLRGSHEEDPTGILGEESTEFKALEFSFYYIGYILVL